LKIGDRVFKSALSNHQLTMARIHRLPLHLANQIAAGEVVERPASVVKELIENALDAGARRISIAIELGGKKSLRVEDDGEGMEAEDARLAIERHATSKIASPEDLGAIRTLGFRGEALPSIASVSHFVLRTRPRGGTTGTEIRVDGGTVSSQREVGAPEGTSIEVADLYYNLPARRKFLKSDAAESAQISRLVTQMALGYPEVGFSLTSTASTGSGQGPSTGSGQGGRRLVECPPAAGAGERFFQLFGERLDLIEVRKEAAGLQIHGYIAALGDQGPVRGAQNVFVNRRIVKDRTIAHAISEAYSVATIKERSPEVHLFIRIPADRVDVNVHPTKAEVRFLEQSLVHEVLRRALGEALGQGRAPELQLTGLAPRLTEPAPMSIPGILSGATVGNRWSREPLGPWRNLMEPWSPDERGTGTAQRDGRSGAALEPGPTTSDIEPDRTLNNPAEPGRTSQNPAPPDAIRPMIPLGQFRDTFIIAIDDEGIAIIDQHVAHERVLFEQVMEKLTAGRLESQRLLTPILIEMSPAQRQALIPHAVTLDTFGFEIEEFGGDSVRLSAVPAVLDPSACEAAVRALAEDLEGLDRGSRVEDGLRKIAATMACHAAVKANYPLTTEKMRYILEELRRTAYSSVCPHGRPVVLRITRREIEKNFQRI
jgi:DNA mismatch repair protein MutL